MSRSAIPLLVALWAGAAAAADGTFRVGITAMPPGMGNPYRQVATTANFVLPSVYDVLAGIDNQGRVVPRLAERWDNPDPLTWVFTLRDGVTFSNGEPLDAEGVKIMFDALRAPESAAAGLTIVRAEAEKFARIEATDRRTLTITLTEPNAILPQRLYMIYVAPGRYFQEVGWEGLATAPVGSGPFTVKRWAVNEIELEANPTTWRPAKFDRLQFRALPDGTARTQALISGQIDAAIAVDPEQAAAIEAAGGAVHQRNPIRILTIAFDTVSKQNPFWDARVRRAANMAVNRERIVATLMGGRVAAASQGAIDNATGYDPDLKPYPYDPDAARALLAEAGYPSGLSFVYEFPSGTLPGDATIMQQIAADLAAVGIRMELRPVTYPQFVRYTSAGGWRGQATLQDFNNNAFDALSPYARGGHGCNGSAPWYCDPKIQPTIDAAEREPDLARRVAMTREIVRHYHDQATSLILFPVLGLDGVGPRVKTWATWNDQIQFSELELAER
ncbi:MAG: ABC transporter substrate-binding protein [Rhodospirillaceae bacterium]|nr:ABC transporter substrate-binding protein [Rhodospirillaceae bacterium]